MENSAFAENRLYELYNLDNENKELICGENMWKDTTFSKS